MAQNTDKPNKRGTNPNSLESLEKHRKTWNSETAVEAGKRSQKVQREKREQRKTMRELLLAVGALQASDDAAAEILADAGIMPTKQAAATLAVVSKAEQGDLEAYQIWRDGIGESPKQTVGISVNTAGADGLKGLSDAELQAMADAAEMDADQDAEDATQSDAEQG